MPFVKSILLIDGSAKDRRRYNDLLKDVLSDSIILKAEDGQSGLNLFRSTSVDCVILELGLPDISGIDVLKVLIATRSSKIPIIVLTRLSYPTVLEIALQTGATAALVKSHTHDHSFQNTVLSALSPLPVAH